MKYLVALALSIAIRYAWAGICFSYYRYYRAESADRMRYFLETHYVFFTYRFFGEPYPEASRQAIKDSGYRGWIFLVAAFSHLSKSIDWLTGPLSCGLLFFSGLMLAYSWYGRRCLRVLGLESISKPPYPIRPAP